MQVHIIELRGRESPCNRRAGGVGGKADESGAPVTLNLARGLQGTAGRKGLVKKFVVIYAVNCEKIHVLDPKEVHAAVEGFQIFGGRCRADLRLDDQLFPGKSRQHATKLAFRRAITAGGFDVIDSD